MGTHEKGSRIVVSRLVALEASFLQFFRQNLTACCLEIREVFREEMFGACIEVFCSIYTATVYAWSCYRIYAGVTTVPTSKPAEALPNLRAVATEPTYRRGNAAVGLSSPQGARYRLCVTQRCFDCETDHGRSRPLPCPFDYRLCVIASLPLACSRQTSKSCRSCMVRDYRLCVAWCGTSLPSMRNKSSCFLVLGRNGQDFRRSG